MNKYGNRRCFVDGIWFPSVREGHPWQELRLLERAGEISELKRQVPFTICPKCKTRDGKAQPARKYIADFTYRDTEGRLVVEDAKGYRTDVYKLKKALMLWLYGIEIREV